MVADERVVNLDEKQPSPGMYVTNDQSPATFQGLVVKTAMNPALIQKAIQKAVYGVNRDQPLTDLKTFEQIRSSEFTVRSVSADFI